MPALIVILVAALSATAVFADNVYYRYPGEGGTVVIDDRLPPEAVPRGYDVIRKDGSVVKTVPPQLTDEQRRAWEQEQAITEARKAAAEKLRQWDESLLLRYSDVEDIDRAKERALNDIRVRISILKSNLTAIKQQVLKDQAEAAELERRGEEVPEALTENLSALRRELAATEIQIQSRIAELDTVADDYERDKERFSKLKARVEKRRNYSSQ